MSYPPVLSFILKINKEFYNQDYTDELFTFIKTFKENPIKFKTHTGEIVPLMSEICIRTDVDIAYFSPKDTWSTDNIFITDLDTFEDNCQGLVKIYYDNTESTELIIPIDDKILKETIVAVLKEESEVGIVYPFKILINELNVAYHLKD